MILEEVRAYQLYLVAIEDEIVVMDCVKALYQIYQNHSSFLNQTAQQQRQSQEGQHFLFTRDILSQPPFTLLMPMMTQFSLRRESSVFHEFVVYLGMLLYNLTYNLFLGSLNIVNGILSELQTILYSENGATTGENQAASKDPSIVPLPVRIDCPLTECLKYYYSSIRKLILYMMTQIWPKFNEDHIVYQKFVAKTQQQTQSLSSPQRASSMVSYSSPAKSTKNVLEVIQSPLPTIKSFFASSPGEHADYINSVTNPSPQRQLTDGSTVLTGLTSPLSPSSPFKQMQSQHQMMTSPYLDVNEVAKIRAAQQQQQLQLRRTSSAAALLMSGGGETVVLVPIHQSIVD